MWYNNYVLTSSWTNRDLRTLCNYWQRTLRLADWEVRVKFGRSRDLVVGDGVAWGRISVQPDHRAAEMLILHPEDHHNAEGRGEIESTIVHELLHIFFDSVNSAEKGHSTPEEQAINAIANALVRLKKRGDKSDRGSKTRSKTTTK